MAEALFNSAPPPGWRATSGGTRPAERPNRRTAAMLNELGVALPPHPPRLITGDQLASAEVVVTMGCLDDSACPRPLRERDPRDWGLPDPSTLDDAGFRQVRDRLAGLVRDLREELRRRSQSEPPSPRRATR